MAATIEKVTVARFSGRFEDYEEFRDEFQAHLAANTALPWARAIDDVRFLQALTLVLTDDTLATILSAVEVRDPTLLAAGERWTESRGRATWQAFESVYGAPAAVRTPNTEIDYHVACDAAAFCPHCKIRVRRMLDLAQQRRWGQVFAELTNDGRLCNYLPEAGERPDDASPERSFFGFGHWAAYHGDADAVSALSRIAEFRPLLTTRRGRLASDIAREVALARGSQHHAQLAAALEDLEVEHEERRLGSARDARRYETESRGAYTAAAATAVPPQQWHELLRPAPRQPSERPDLRHEAPYRWPDSDLATWPMVRDPRPVLRQPHGARASDQPIAPGPQPTTATAGRARTFLEQRPRPF